MLPELFEDVLLVRNGSEDVAGQGRLRCKVYFLRISDLGHHHHRCDDDDEVDDDVDETDDDGDEFDTDIVILSNIYM